MLSKKELQYMNHGKIYKIVCNVTGLVYYGSTTLSLNRRLSIHKSDYKQYLNGNTNYKTSFKILETGDYNIHLVEDYKCLNKKQLESIERVYIEGYPCINKNVAGRTRKEINKAYREKNKHKLNEMFECECGGKFTYSSKARHMRSIKHQKYLLRKEYLIPNFKSCSL
jgi:hypothetical protein